MKRKNSTSVSCKHPIMKSFWQIILLAIVFLALTYFLYVLTEQIFILPLFLLGIIASILILFSNLKGRNYFLVILKKILTVVKHPIVFIKEHWKVLSPITAVIIILFITLTGREYLIERKLCENNDKTAYYCSSHEPVLCKNGYTAVIDGKNNYKYKCINNDQYKHDILGQEYDYKCTEKYARTEKDVNLDDYMDEIKVDGNTLIYEQEIFNKDLIKNEQQCLYDKIDNELNVMIADKKKSIPSKFDIRDKVSVKAGNQERSDTCVLWTLTKALEISAQLKGLDYQFLLDYEKTINGITYTPSGTPDKNGVIHFGLDYLVPGNKRTVVFQSFESDYVNPDFTGIYYPPYSTYSKTLVDSYKEFDKIAERKCTPYSENGFHCETFFDEQEDEFYFYVIKDIVMKYGSAFIQTDPESKKFANGHMMLIIGWDDSKESWLVLNSWGNTWADDPEMPSNGDGTTWIKYSNEDYVPWTEYYGLAIELISE